MSHDDDANRGTYEQEPNCKVAASLPEGGVVAPYDLGLGHGSPLLLGEGEAPPRNTEYNNYQR